MIQLRLVYKFSVQIFYKTLVSEGFSYTTFTSLFHWKVWIGIVVLFISLSILFNYLHGHVENGSTLEAGMVFIYPIRLLCGQGIEQDAQKMATRTVLTISLAASLVINASYSANLTSHLFNKKIPVPFSNLDELKNTSYKYGTVDGSVYTDTILAVTINFQSI